MKNLLCLLFLLQICFSQSLLPVYEGKVKPKFELEWEIGGVDNEKLTIVDPEFIQLDDTGNIYYFENEECKIVKLSPDGKFINSFGRKGKGPGEFLNCECFYIENNVLYINDRTQNCIIKYDSSGKYLGSTKYKMSFSSFVKTRNGYSVKNLKSKKTGKNLFRTFSLTDCDQNLSITTFRDSLQFLKYIFKELVVPVTFSPNSFLFKTQNNHVVWFNSDNNFISIYNGNEFVAKTKLSSEDKVVVKQVDKDNHSERYKNLPEQIKLLEYATHKPYFQYVLQDKCGYFLLRSNKSEKNNIFQIVDNNGNRINEIVLPQTVFKKKTKITKDGVFTFNTDEEGFISLAKYKLK